MPKKSFAKTPMQMQENLVVEEEKPSPASKKRGNEIDEIFSAKKRKKREQEKAEKLKEDVSEKPKKIKKKKSKGAKEGGFVEPTSRPRKKTEDGLTVYREEELGIGKADAGGTPLCPFDCSCCF
ncbi:hypothetical protein L1049_018927 [Liquidambar formosana]|uniref:DUF1764 domain-containing protein n=1 Tax=Liquidambar formosana TaxID=63359 RepID=A0AAP0RAU3_LIQFO